MAMKKKTELKDVFSSPGSLMFQKGIIDLANVAEVTISPELELPVKVDSLKVEQGDPSITHYKIIGMEGDWVSSAEIGDFEISLTVPTKSPDVLKWAHGEDAVKDGVKIALGTAKYEGHSLVLKKHKVYGTFFIEDDTQENIMILSGVALWAKPLLDDGKVYAIGLTGTIEVGDKPSIAWIKKKA